MQTNNCGVRVEETSERNKEQFVTATVSNENVLGISAGEDYWGENFVSVTSEENTNYKVVRKNHFAYNPSRINVGSVVINISEKPVAVSSAYITFKVFNNNYLPEYIYTVLKYSAVATEIKNRSYGTVRQTLSFEDLSTIQIEKVPMNEQKKIVDRYRNLCSDYKSIKEKLDNFSF